MFKNKPVKVVSNSRVACAEQEKGFDSLVHKEKLNNDYIKCKHMKKTKSFSVHGSGLDPSPIKEMLVYLESTGTGILVCKDLARLTRSHEIYLSILAWLGCKPGREVYFSQDGTKLSSRI